MAPAYLRLQARGESLTFAESLPFAGTPVGAELARLRAPLGRERLNIVREMETCSVVGQRLVSEVAGVAERVDHPSRGLDDGALASGTGGLRRTRSPVC